MTRAQAEAWSAERKAKKRAYNKAYQSTEAERARIAEYRARPEVLARNRARDKARYARERDRKLAHMRVYNARPEVQARVKAYNATPEARAMRTICKLKPRAKAREVARKYRVAIEDVLRLRAIPACQSCAEPFRTVGCIDHDHASGVVRGVLCNGCNAAIGFAKDSPERLRAMADYLERQLRAVA